MRTGRELRNILPAFFQLRDHGDDGYLRSERRKAHGKKRCDDGDVANAVDEETVAFTEAGDDEAGERWADKARHVDHRRVERDGVAEIFAALDHLHQESLATGHVKRIDEPLACAEDEYFRNGDAVGECEGGKRQRLQHRECLSDDEDVTPVEAVNPHAGERREEERWDLAGEADDTEQPGRAGQSVDEPSGGNTGHPRADQRDALAGEKETEVTVAEGAPR